MPREFDRGAGGTTIQQFSRDVLWLDDCKGTFKYLETGTGGDDVHTYDTTGSFFSTNGIHLVTRTTATADGDVLRIGRKLSFPVGGELYLRARLGVGDVSLLELIHIGVLIHDGAKEYMAGLTYKPNVPSLSYDNAASGLTAIPAGAHQLGDWQQSIIELAVDVANKKYLAAMWLGTEMSLVDLAIEEVGASGVRQVEFFLDIEASSAAAASLFADSVYVGSSQAV